MTIKATAFDAKMGTQIARFWSVSAARAWARNWYGAGATVKIENANGAIVFWGVA